MAKRGAEKGNEECPQALKRTEDERLMSELKLRPPKRPSCNSGRRSFDAKGLSTAGGA